MSLESFTIQEGFVQPMSLTEPSNIFTLQNQLSNQLNNYQTKYARYMRCNDPNTNAQVENPSCDLDGSDSFSDLTIAYRSLSASIDKLGAAYKTQGTGSTPEEYNQNVKIIPDDYRNLIDLRDRLDNQLSFLQKQLETGGGESTRWLKSTVFINTLLVIAAFSILYYILFGL
jgi:hypothetical protein